MNNKTNVLLTTLLIFSIFIPCTQGVGLGIANVIKEKIKVIDQEVKETYYPINNSTGTTTTTQYGTVSGLVADITDYSSIQSATVTVTGTALTTLTSHNGQYTLSNVPLGNKTVEVTAAGYITSSQNITVIANTNKTLNFLMQPVPSTGTTNTATLYGTVKSTAASSINNATVLLQGTTLQTTTNNSGQYTITNITPGNFVARVTVTGYDQVIQTVTISGLTQHNFILNLTTTAVPVPTVGSITGTIKNSVTSANINNALVLLQGTTSYSATTNPQGKYTINNVVQASYTVVASATGYYSQSVSTYVPASVQVRMNFNLVPLPQPSTSYNITVPTATVKLIFIHHSTGENWLADDNGGLGTALKNNNYYVSDTNYGWGPSSIGDSTDIGHWYNWFRGTNSSTYMAAVYSETGQNCTYTRLTSNPGGQNEVVMFKSCFPNSALQGNASTAVPSIGNNLLKGQDSSSDYHTISNAKGIYTDILEYFRAHQEKLFIVITAPPLTDATYSSNARTFNNWLVNTWLANYQYNNVFVFDFYNVLTTNGGSSSINDLGFATGNHHRWYNNAIQHKTDGDADSNANILEYPTGDDHPSQAGNLKATSEFIPLLNIAYNRWKGN
ncbi:MAG: carboxypeptidase-like regulatory domain-containing protein [Elusimicrobiota bacterium]